LHSTAQHSTAQHSTAQHSTAQHSTAQHSRNKFFQRLSQEENHKNLDKNYIFKYIIYLNILFTIL
jgi:adenine-specific DNA-methyltransferase